VKAPGKDCLAAPDRLVVDYNRVSIVIYWTTSKDLVIARPGPLPPSKPLTHPLLLPPHAEATRDIEEWRCQDSARKKMLAAVIRREIVAHADELRRRGVHNPVTQAEAEIAKRWQHASGAALNRWLRRNR
jgi:hypothetical protein